MLLTIGAAGCSDSPTAPEEPTAPEGPTQITWSASARGLPGEIYERLTFNCAAGGQPGRVWGSFVYTDDSSICTAGVQVGAITLAAGGRVTIEFRHGMHMYHGTTLNGITSHSFDTYARSLRYSVSLTLGRLRQREWADGTGTATAALGKDTRLRRSREGIATTLMKPCARRERH